MSLEELEPSLSLELLASLELLVVLELLITLELLVMLELLATLELLGLLELLATLELLGLLELLATLELLGLLELLATLELLGLLEDETPLPELRGLSSCDILRYESSSDPVPPPASVKNLASYKLPIVKPELSHFLKCSVREIVPHLRSDLRMLKIWVNVLVPSIEGLFSLTFLIIS
jgi:hypothetical protein